MNTSEQILVIFLSTALAVLLVLAIMAAVLAIRLLRTLSYIAEKAEQFIDSAESTVEMIKRAAGPLNFLGFMRGLMSMVTKSKDKEKE